MVMISERPVAAELDGRPRIGLGWDSPAEPLAKLLGSSVIGQDASRLDPPAG